MVYTAARIGLWRFCCQCWEAPKIEWQEARALCLGLDDAGSTSLLRRACGSTCSDKSPGPTLGFEVRTLSRGPHWKLSLWDIGGSRQMRRFWSKYVGEEEAIVWVVDASARARLAESRAGAVAPPTPPPPPARVHNRCESNPPPLRSAWEAAGRRGREVADSSLRQQGVYLDMTRWLLHSQPPPQPARPDGL